MSSPAPRSPSQPAKNPANGVSTPRAEPAPAAEIDLEALAEQVYVLLREELRRERERLGRTWHGV
jgi:hypothetical protein